MSDPTGIRDTAMAPGPTPNHNAAGKFIAGNRANPGGRSKVQYAVQAILDEAAPDGARELRRLMLEADDEGDRISAIKIVLEHSIGKPKERDDDGEPLMNDILADLLASRRPPSL